LGLRDWIALVVNCDLWQDVHSWSVGRKIRVLGFWESKKERGHLFIHYNKSLESSSHLFIHCHFSWSLWMKLLSNRGFCSVFSKFVDDMFYQWSSMVKGKQQNLSWQLLFSCVVWNLWLYRNDIICNNVAPNLQICFSMVRQSIALWLRLDSSSLELHIENVQYGGVGFLWFFCSPICCAPLFHATTFVLSFPLLVHLM